MAPPAARNKPLTARNQVGPGPDLGSFSWLFWDLRGVINRGLAEQIRYTFLGRILGLEKEKQRKSKKERRRKKRSSSANRFL